MLNELFHIYGDESRQTKDKYMLFGGIMVKEAIIPSLEVKIKNWRENNRMYAELKWTKVSKGKLEVYKELVSLFFSLATQRLLTFKSVVFDTSKIDYKKHYSGDKELGFYSLMAEFLPHFRKSIVSHEQRLLVFLDERNSHYSLSDLKALSNQKSRELYEMNVELVRNIQPIRSHESDFLQIADILMGAVGYHYNRCHHRPHASEAKIDLAQYISNKVGLKELTQPIEREDFEILEYFCEGKRMP